MFCHSIIIILGLLSQRRGRNGNVLHEVTNIMCSKKLTNKKLKILSEKSKKDILMACDIPPLKKAKKNIGNPTTHPQSHPIPKFYVA